MRLFALFLMTLLAVACGGEPTGQDTAPSAAPTPQIGVPQGDDGKTTTNAIARLGKVVSPEWARIERFTKQFYNGELDELYANFSDAFKQEFSMQDLVDLRDRVLTEYGEEVKVVATRKEENEDYRAFFRAVHFSNDERLIEIVFVIGPDELIGGLYVTPDRGDASPVQ